LTPVNEMTICGLCTQQLIDEQWLFLHMLTHHDHRDVLLTPESAQRIVPFTWPYWIVNLKREVQN
jgi:hypothetical protein